MTSESDQRPYRPCVGIMLINPSGLVWVGRRLGGHEHIKGGPLWQMPQGGIDKGEQPLDAAFRELHEETSVHSARLLQEASQWFNYDLPGSINSKGWPRRYRGQTQKWFAFSFEGDENEINIAAPDGHKPEFDDWKWVEMADLPKMIVAFKRQVYEQVIQEFSGLAKTK